MTNNDEISANNDAIVPNNDIIAPNKEKPKKIKVELNGKPLEKSYHLFPPAIRKKIKKDYKEATSRKKFCDEWNEKLNSFGVFKLK